PKVGTEDYRQREEAHQDDGSPMAPTSPSHQNKKERLNQDGLESEQGCRASRATSGGHPPAFARRKRQPERRQHRQRRKALLEQDRAQKKIRSSESHQRGRQELPTTPCAQPARHPPHLNDNQR